MQNDYTILSIDLGSTTGWAFVVNGVIKESGSINFVRKDSHPGDRFVRFQNWINKYVGINEITYEDVPRFESAAAAKSYCGYLSMLQAFCLVHGIRMTCIKPSAVKSGFSGKGNAKKIEMCEVAHKLGWKNGHPGTDIDHDECDAIATVWVLLDRRGVKPSIG